jgi:hypothetical protein
VGIFGPDRVPTKEYMTADPDHTQAVRRMSEVCERLGLRSPGGRYTEEVLAEISTVIIDRLEAIERRLPPEVD